MAPSICSFIIICHYAAIKYSKFKFKNTTLHMGGTTLHMGCTTLHMGSSLNWAWHNSASLCIYVFFCNNQKHHCLELSILLKYDPLLQYWANYRLFHIRYFTGLIFLLNKFCLFLRKFLPKFFFFRLLQVRNKLTPHFYSSLQL